MCQSPTPPVISRAGNWQCRTPRQGLEKVPYSFHITVATDITRPLVELHIYKVLVVSFPALISLQLLPHIYPIDFLPRSINSTYPYSSGAARCYYIPPEICFENLAAHLNQPENVHNGFLAGSVFLPITCKRCGRKWQVRYPYDGMFSRLLLRVLDFHCKANPGQFPYFR